MRRERGDGTLFFDPDRDWWIGQLDLRTDPTRKRHRPKVSAPTRAEAKAKRTETRVTAGQVTSGHPTGSTPGHRCPGARAYILRPSGAPGRQG